MAAGPNSFVTDPGQTPLSSGSGFDAAFNSSNQVGGGTRGVIVDSTGAINTIRGNMAAMDSIVEFANQKIQPKLEEMQKNQLWEGVRRAAKGESMDDIRGEQGFFARMLGGESYLAKGAAMYQGTTKVVEMARRLSDDEKNAEMPEDEFQRMVISETDSLMTGDPMVDSIVQSTAISTMGQVFQMQSNSRSKKLREDIERERYNHSRAQADLALSVARAAASGKIDKPTADASLSNITAAILAKGEDETDASYVRRVSSIANQAATKGNLSVIDSIIGSPAQDMMDATDQQTLRSVATKAYKEGLLNLARDNPEIFNNFRYAIATASTPEEAGLASEAFNTWTRVMMGATSENLSFLEAVDSRDAELKGRFELRQNQIDEQERINEFRRSEMMNQQYAMYRSEILSGKYNNDPAGMIERARQISEIGERLGLKASDLHAMVKNPSGNLDDLFQNRLREEQAMSRRNEEAEKERLKALEWENAQVTSATLILAGSDSHALARLNDDEAQQAITRALGSIQQAENMDPEEKLNRQVNLLVRQATGVPGSNGPPVLHQTTKRELVGAFEYNSFRPSEVQRSIDFMHRMKNDPSGKGYAALELYFGEDLLGKITQFEEESAADPSKANESYLKHFGPSYIYGVPSGVPVNKDISAMAESIAESKLMPGFLWGAAETGVDVWVNGGRSPSGEGKRLFVERFGAAAQRISNQNRGFTPEMIANNAMPVAMETLDIANAFVIDRTKGTPTLSMHLEGKGVKYDHVFAQRAIQKLIEDAGGDPDDIDQVSIRSRMENGVPVLDVYSSTPDDPGNPFGYSLFTYDDFLEAYESQEVDVAQQRERLERHRATYSRGRNML